jgi:hypothetical protein
MELTQVCRDQADHPIVVTNELVLKPDHLNRVAINEKVNAAEQSRQSRDLLYRLLFCRDISELRHHAEGLVGEAGAVKNGLLYRTYGASLSRRGFEVMTTSANLLEHPYFKDHEDRQRLVFHFIVFVALLTEQSFCEYVRNRSADVDALRRFICEGLVPLTDKLLTGNMATNADGRGRVDLVHFTTQVRTLYCAYCTPAGNISSTP